jgi:hypothetical protein
MWGPQRADPLSTCRPLAVEVYAPAPELLAGWTVPSADYRGLHGLSGPGWER